MYVLDRGAERILERRKIYGLREKLNEKDKDG